MARLRTLLAVVAGALPLLSVNAAWAAPRLDAAAALERSEAAIGSFQT